MLKILIKIIGILLGSIGIFFLTIFLWFAIAVKMDIKWVIGNLEERADLDHLELCELKRNDFSYHEVYIDNRCIPGEVDEMTIGQWLALCKEYIEINSINPKAIKNISFCNKCVLLPEDPDYRYPEVVKKKNQNLIVEFSFNMANDSMSIINNVNDITFWKNSAKKNYLSNYNSNEFVDIKSIEDFPLGYFYDKYWAPHRKRNRFNKSYKNTNN